MATCGRWRPCRPGAADGAASMPWSMALRRRCRSGSESSSRMARSSSISAPLTCTSTCLFTLRAHVARRPRQPLGDQRRAGVMRTVMTLSCRSLTMAWSRSTPSSSPRRCGAGHGPAELADPGGGQDQLADRVEELVEHLGADAHGAERLQRASGAAGGRGGAGAGVSGSASAVGPRRRRGRRSAPASAPAPTRARGSRSAPQPLAGHPAGPEVLDGRGEDGRPRPGRPASSPPGRPAPPVRGSRARCPPPPQPPVARRREGLGGGGRRLRPHAARGRRRGGSPRRPARVRGGAGAPLRQRRAAPARRRSSMAASAAGRLAGAGGLRPWRCSASPAASRTSTAVGVRELRLLAPEDVDQVLGPVGEGGDALELHRRAIPFTLWACRKSSSTTGPDPRRRRRRASPAAPAPARAASRCSPASETKSARYLREVQFTVGPPGRATQALAQDLLHDRERRPRT